MDDREPREVWAKRVEQWADSKLTAEEFAKEAGVPSHKLKWWKWHLGKGVSGQSKTPEPTTPKSAPSKNAPKDKQRPLDFVEMTSAVAAAAIEIVLPSNVCIRVPTNFDATALRRLLDVLERR